MKIDNRYMDSFILSLIIKKIFKLTLSLNRKIDPDSF